VRRGVSGVNVTLPEIRQILVQIAAYFVLQEILSPQPAFNTLKKMGLGDWLSLDHQPWLQQILHQLPQPRQIQLPSQPTPIPLELPIELEALKQKVPLPIYLRSLACWQSDITIIQQMLRQQGWTEINIYRDIYQALCEQHPQFPGFFAGPSGQDLFQRLTPHDLAMSPSALQAFKESIIHALGTPKPQARILVTGSALTDISPQQWSSFTRQFKLGWIDLKTQLWQQGITCAEVITSLAPGIELFSTSFVLQQPPGSSPQFHLAAYIPYVDQENFVPNRKYYRQALKRAKRISLVSNQRKCHPQQEQKCLQSMVSCLMPSDFLIVVQAQPGLALQRLCNQAVENHIHTKRLDLQAAKWQELTPDYFKDSLTAPNPKNGIVINTHTRRSKGQIVR
jgi:hypothetical protein